MFAELSLNGRKLNESSNDDYLYRTQILHTFFSDDICAEFIKKYPLLVHYIPKNRFIKIIEKNIKILEENPYIIAYVDKSLQSQEMVDIILTKDESLLCCINPNFIDISRLKKFPHAIKHIPREIQTKEMLDFIILHNDENLFKYLNSDSRIVSVPDDAIVKYDHMEAFMDCL